VLLKARHHKAQIEQPLVEGPILLWPIGCGSEARFLADLW
jgi:hypothetical protein